MTLQRIKWKPRRFDKGASLGRQKSNFWVSDNTELITGDVLSIGSMKDEDGEGNHYRDYFSHADSYTTSDIEGNVDLMLDVMNMKSVPSNSYDCIFCAGVLEHVTDPKKAINEMRRILRPNGIILVGVPFRQPIHMTDDYWRFTVHAIVYLFKDWDIKEIHPIDTEIDNFPVAYWLKAVKKLSANKLIKNMDKSPIVRSSKKNPKTGQVFKVKKNKGKGKSIKRKRNESGKIQKAPVWKPFGI